MSEGYEVLRELDARGRKVCTIVKHPEDAEKFEMIFRLALEGKSRRTISLELERRGYLTRPLRKDRKPQPFGVRRIGLTLSNPFYAGLQAWGDELFSGDWPRYIEPEDFYRLKAERQPQVKDRGGHPAAAVYLLSQEVRGQPGGHRGSTRFRLRSNSSRTTCGTSSVTRSSWAITRTATISFCPFTSFARSSQMDVSART